ncbi:MAG: RNA 2',3'-cyclic phosphodiesterase [Gammaproteobacteria bacterium]
MKPQGASGAPADTDTERLFIGLWPDSALRARVDELAAPAVRKARARPVPADNLHVTVVFIGNWPVAAREQAEMVVDALDIPDEDLVFDRIVRWRKAKVVALVTDQIPDALAAWQRDIAAGLAAAGWTPEPRPWRPHVTVGRKAEGALRKTLEEPLVWPCRQVALVRSENDGGGSVYRPLRVWER